VFKSELTLKSIFNIKKKINDLLKTNKPEERNHIITDIDNEYTNVINLSRLIFFYIIQLLFDRSK